MDKRYSILYIMVGILLSIVLLLTSVEVIVFNITHYEKSFKKYNIPQATGMDMDNLMYTIEDILSYLKGEKDELDTRAIVKGEEREVFSEREKLHMVDVQKLFMKGKQLRNAGAVLLAVLLIILVKLDGRWKKRLSKTLIYMALGNIGLLVILLLLMFIDFYKYFTYFHLIFFDNDLWILDPEKEILIQMLPQDFFYDTAVKIISLFIGVISALGIGGYVVSKKIKEKYL